MLFEYGFFVICVDLDIIKIHILTKKILFYLDKSNSFLFGNIRIKGFIFIKVEHN